MLTNGDDMTRNTVSPSFEGTTPTMTPSSTHTLPTVVDPHSPSGTLTKGAFSCIVQECAHRVSTEFTVCDVCHGRATTMFQEMRKFSRPCADCQNPVFALATQVQPSDVLCQQCILKRMPPPPGLPPSAPKIARPIAPAQVSQKVPFQSNGNGHRRTTSEQFMSRPRVAPESMQIPQKRKASGGPNAFQPMPTPQVRRMPPTPVDHQGFFVHQHSPTLVINPISRAVRVVQPAVNPQSQLQIVQLRDPQPFPWPPHQSFHELVGLPHLNSQGEYIYPQATRLNQTQQRRPSQQSHPTKHEQASLSSAARKKSFSPESTPSSEASSSRSTPSRLAASGLHRCNAPGCVTLIPNSNPAPYCKRCSTLDVCSPIQTPKLLPLSLNSNREFSNLEAAGPSRLSYMFKGDIPSEDLLSSSRQTSEADFHPSSPPSPIALPRGLNWDSDVSELTPLEDSSGEDDSTSSDEDGELRPRLVLRLPPRKFPQPAPPSDPKRPLDLSEIVLPDKWKLDPSKNFICNVTGCYNLLRPMSRTPLRLCLRHKNAIKTHCKRHPDGPGDTPTDSQRPKRRCRSKGCMNEIPPKSEHPWRACEDCRFRRQRAKAFKYGPLWEFLSNPHGPDFLRNPLAQDSMETYPRYQDFKGLLGSFEFSLMGFLVGQIQYLQHKLDEEQTTTPAKDAMTAPDVRMGDGDNEETKFTNYTPLAGKARQEPTVFDFDGEYSMVADPAGGDVSKRIQDVRKAIEGVIGCELSSGGLFVAPKGRIIGRFHCTHETTIQKSPPSSETLMVQSNRESLSPDIPLASFPKLGSYEPMSVDIPTPTTRASPPSPAKEVFSRGSEPTSPLSSDTTHNSADNSTLVPDENSEASNDTLVGPQESEKELSIIPSEVIKRMSGELQVIISWDRRHRYFPGLRTVVRFKLVG